MDNRRSDRHKLFVVSACVPMDCSPDTMKATFYQKLPGILRTVKWANFMILTGDIKARVGRLSSIKGHLRDSVTVDISFC